MADAIAGFLALYIVTLAPRLKMIAGLTVGEMIAPVERHPIRARLPALVFWLIYAATIPLMAVGLAKLWSALNWTPIFSLDMGSWLSRQPAAARWAGMLFAPLLAALIGDFLFYWFHRAQHAFLWRFHAVHHSIRHLNAAGSYHHISEEVFVALLITIPMTLLADIRTGPALPFLGFYLAFSTHYLHSTVRLHLGPLRYVFQDNRYHRIHHSLEPHHFDKNFGGVFTIWDQAFRTAYFPKPGEWPATGLADQPEAASLRDWMLRPLIRQPNSTTG